MEVVLINDNAIISTRASKQSAGLDLYCSIDVCIEIGSIKKINTGIRVFLPENFMDLSEINLLQQLKDC